MAARTLEWPPLRSTAMAELVMSTAAILFSLILQSVSSLGRFIVIAALYGAVAVLMAVVWRTWQAGHEATATSPVNDLAEAWRPHCRRAQPLPARGRSAGAFGRGAQPHFHHGEARHLRRHGEEPHQPYLPETRRPFKARPHHAGSGAIEDPASTVASASKDRRTYWRPRDIATEKNSAAFKWLGNHERSALTAKLRLRCNTPPGKTPAIISNRASWSSKTPMFRDFQAI